MMLNVERERLYRTLSRQVSELTPDRRQALSTELRRMNPGRLTDALRKAITQSGRTAAAIAWDADVNPSQVYRFLEGKTIKLDTADRLAELLGLDLTHAATTTKKVTPATPKKARQMADKEYNASLAAIVTNAAAKKAKPAR